MNQLYQRFTVFWAARQPRERAFLIALVTFAGAALLAQILWTSHGARVRLTKQIPQLEQQVERLQRQTTELHRIKTQPPLATPGEGSALLSAAAAAAKDAGLAQIIPKLQNEGPRRLRLRATVPFDGWLAWAAMLQRDWGVRLVSCRIEADAVPGSANIDALFALPEPT